MALFAAAARRNLSLVEIAVAIALVALLAAVFFARVRGIEAAAERAIVTAAFQDMQSRSLMYTTAFVLGELSVAEIAQQNPVATVAGGLTNYAGEFADPDWDAIPPGTWFYDTRAGLLVYRVINEEAFATALRAPARLRFRVTPRFDDRNRNGRRDPDTEPVRAIRVEALDAAALTAAAGGR